MTQQERDDIILKQLEEMRELHEKNAVRTMRIERALIGDKEFGIKGVVERVNNHSDMLHNHGDQIKTIKTDMEKKEAKKKGVVIGLGAAGAAGGYGIVEWIKSLFS